jgi:hypothetical protein
MRWLHDTRTGPVAFPPLAPAAQDRIDVSVRRHSHNEWTKSRGLVSVIFDVIRGQRCDSNDDPNEGADVAQFIASLGIAGAFIGTTYVWCLRSHRDNPGLCNRTYAPLVLFEGGLLACEGFDAFTRGAACEKYFKRLLYGDR